MLEEFKLDDNIICIDFKSYYATVECAKRGLDPLTTKLVVANHENGPSAVCLAISPAVKALGVSGRPRLRDIIDIPGLIIVKPHMQDYVDRSIAILKIYLNYVSREDIYIYSIDEAFLDLTNYLKLYQTTDYDLAKKIMQDVYEQTGILSTCGIGPNMIMAKFALDIESKHTPDMIAKWKYEDLPTKLWPIMNMQDVWSIGRRKQIRLNKMGLYTIEDIAKCPVERLIKEFGILGEELYLHVHGIDISKVNSQSIRVRKNMGRGHTLSENYYNEDVLNILLEINYEVLLELQKLGQFTSLISISWGYEYTSNVRGFAKSMKIASTNSFLETAQIIKRVFEQNYKKDLGVRKIAISLGGLTDNQIYQYDLFSRPPKSDAKLEETLLKLRQKYGDDAARISISNRQKAIGRRRSKLIGGHNA